MIFFSALSQYYRIFLQSFLVGHVIISPPPTVVTLHPVSGKTLATDTFHFLFSVPVNETCFLSIWPAAVWFGITENIYSCTFKNICCFYIGWNYVRRTELGIFLLYSDDNSAHSTVGLVQIKLKYVFVNSLSPGFLFFLSLTKSHGLTWYVDLTWLT